jgi:hypothetical protein
MMMLLHEGAAAFLAVMVWKGIKREIDLLEYLGWRLEKDTT